ncbi:hypothetical protein FACS189467_3170 [Bacteroidia bacterium]|nr:hypothetical protein FACS189467_3170 [Bacteroidia bacterium]
MTVNYLPSVELYLFELIETLYRENYFSFPEDAVEYVQKIRHYIESHIHITIQHNAPAHFVRYGRDMQYITYRDNEKTHWYVFFQQKDNIYLVRYITNNHIAAQYFSH